MNTTAIASSTAGFQTDLLSGKLTLLKFSRRGW